MAFVPKLPSWQITVQVYRKIVNTYANVGEIFGQIYTPLRNQDDDEGGLLYFMMPKNEITPPYKGNPGPFGWMLPRTPYDGIADVIEVPLPGGNGTAAYEVRDMRPRWLGFPNEHILLDLQRLNANEWNTTTHQPPSVPPIPVPPPESPAGYPSDFLLKIHCVENGDCDECEVLNADWPLKLVSGSIWKGPLFLWGCAPTGRAFWHIQHFYGATDESNENDILSASLIDGAAYDLDFVGAHLIASWQGTVGSWNKIDPLSLPFWSSNEQCDMGDCLTVEPDIDIDDGVTPPPTTWEMEIIDAANNNCSVCEDMVGTYTLLQVGTVHHWHTEIPFNCLGGLFNQMSADLDWLPDGTFSVSINHGSASGPVPFAVFSGTTVGWDGVSDITLTLVSADDTCTFNNIVVRPSA